ncbi:hypothetical protein FRB99_004047 [Tulasnella sp. 403]|nr:hypothetical protein FRB99_004047 [Tulasnella sp. 403]
MSHPDHSCRCWRSPPSSNSGSDCSAASSSTPFSRTSSSSSLQPFPPTEPADYCRPTLSVETRLKQSQRLAVLLPQSLWKADKDANECDNFVCKKRFSLFERKHHCRKCGNIFCQACSSNSIPLLDTSNMPFVIPPANIPLPLLAASSPTGALVDSRVCDDCHAQLRGDLAPSRVRSATSPASPAPILSTSLDSTCSSAVPVLSRSPGSACSVTIHGDAASIASAPDPAPTFVAKPRHLRSTSRPNISRTRSSPLIPSSPLASRRDSIRSGSDGAPLTTRSVSPSSSVPSSRRTSVATTTSQTSYADLGVLSEYPLKVSSRGCKQSGAAFWKPKPLARRVDSPVRYDSPAIRVIRQPVREEDEDACEDEDDEGAPPVMPVRRTIRIFRDVSHKAPFASPDLQREKDCISTF